MSHRERILDQFTRQAVPFSEARGIRDADALRLLVETAGAGPDDTVLDVACGPGLVVCAFARVVRHATGIDVTPAMLERARALAEAEGLTNVTWRHGDVLPLPWPDASFSIVVSRFAFHHFEAPGAVLAEMRRVCRPGGRVVVCDLLASDDPAKAERFHALEMRRDPSHVRALRLDDLRGLFADADLAVTRDAYWRLPFEVEDLLRRSFPAPEDVPLLRAGYHDSVDGDALGLDARRVGDTVHASYPIAVLVADR